MILKRANRWVMTERKPSTLCPDVSIYKTARRKYVPWLVKNRVSILRKKHRTSSSYWRNDGANKENLYFDDQSKEVVSLFLSQCCLKERENMFYVFLSSYRNTRESLGELKKAVETLACSHSIKFSKTSTPVYITWYYFLNKHINKHFKSRSSREK